MSHKFSPNSFQVPNAFVDLMLADTSGNATKCYLVVIRKTKGWNKEQDEISVSQFKKFTGIRKDKTVTDALEYLIENGLIKANKRKGRITKYGLANHPQNKVPPIKDGTPNKSGEPPPKKEGTTTPKKRGSTKDTIKNNITKGKTNKKEIPENLNLEAWEKWIEFKKQIKKSYKTETGINHAMKSLSSLPYNRQMDCINYSIQNEYQGFFPENFKGEDHGKAKPVQHRPTAYEQQQANRAKEAELIRRERENEQAMEQNGGHLRQSLEQHQGQYCNDGR